MINIGKTLVALGALFVLCVPLIVSESMLFPYITGKNFTFRILVEITAALWLVVCIYDRDFRPRASLILWSFIAFLGVLAAAAVNGIDPIKSFWSNFERMEGWVGLVHFFLYFLILASVFREKTFLFLGKKYSFIQIFLTVSVAVAALVGFLAILEKFDPTNTKTDWRLTGTTGNAAYMALYMLFAAFSAVLLSISQKETWQRVGLWLLTIFFLFLLLQTATRGVVIGLAVTAVGTLGYLALFWQSSKKPRQYVLGGLVVVVTLVTVVSMFRDVSFVEQNRILQRATNINMEELTVRMTVWGVALEGVKERPILGWGQGNFSYIFTKYYEPSLANQELWFDRAHNVFMDWLVAGGVLGLFSYLMLFISAAWYVVIRPRIFSTDSFSVGEQAALFGISAGYFVQNLVVFDTLISYIYFAAILAFIHARIGKDWYLTRLSVPRSKDSLTKIALPAAGVLMLAVCYAVNIPSMLAATGVINGMQGVKVSQPLAQPLSPEEIIKEFSVSFNRTEMAQTEVLRMSIDKLNGWVGNKEIPESAQDLLKKEVEAMEKTITARRPLTAPEASSLYQFYARFDPEKALPYAAYAHELGPRKIDLIINHGAAEFFTGDTEAAQALWNEAYELSPNGHIAKDFKAAALVLAGQGEEIFNFFDEASLKRIVQNEFVASLVYQRKEMDLFKKIHQQKIMYGVADERTYVTLSMLAYEAGEKEEALALIQEATERFPEYTASFACAASNIEKNVSINLPCE